MEDVLAALSSLSIEYDRHDHEPVMTCEKQIEVLGASPESVTKNLLLKDKKSRLFLVTALSDTPINLNMLSQRLGTGKGGLRMAPEVDVAEHLEVQPGSLTPLALAAPKAGDVAFLLDARIQSVDRIFVHPGINTISLALTPVALESFLKSVGREISYVDLTAEPTLDANNRPDLSHITQTAVPVPKRESQETALSAPQQVSTSKPKKAKEPTNNKKKVVAARPAVLDTNALAKQIAQEVSFSNGAIPEALESTLKITLNALRNAAYAEGFAAAKGAMRATLAGVH